MLSACVETELVSNRVELNTIRLAQSWWYIFTYWPESAALCGDENKTQQKETLLHLKIMDVYNFALCKKYIYEKKKSVLYISVA